MLSALDLWDRYQKTSCRVLPLGLTLDISRMRFPTGFFARMVEPMESAFAAMAELEAGAIANPDEERMVGHYWLRNPSLAPTDEIRQLITDSHQQIAEFTARIHDGQLKPETEDRFTHLLIIGIGGSALGPQFVSDALAEARSPMQAHFFDNTDPDGMRRVLETIGDDLASTLNLVVSKSGGTKETRNGMLIAKSAYKARGLEFGRHAVAVTGEESELDHLATAENWLARFPMWDWVGGRTSELSAVGLLPAALQGIDWREMLEGARLMDEATRVPEISQNPAAVLALMWHYAGDGAGKKDMVVLPYKDRLLLFSRYLQQLIMESIGKERNLFGEVVNQGLSVYGNKGSTDQHAYVQQLREGIHNFFVTFIQVLKDEEGDPLEVEPGTTAGDYLNGFFLGTRQALYENGRDSMTITIPHLDARMVGALIALFERAVGFYASLVGINAYHQPGVEAGKKAATAVLELQARVLAAMQTAPTTLFSAPDLARELGCPDSVETIYRILGHLAANGRAVYHPGPDPTLSLFGFAPATYSQ